jgi:hypothetical protein
MDSQFLSIANCTNFTTSELLSLNLSISITGGLCLLISSLIILLLFFNKAYSSLLQRLFLYLMVATALRQLSLLSLIEHYFYYTGQREVCIVVAYFNHWMVAMTLFFATGMLFYLFYMVNHLAKGKTLTPPTIIQSKFRRIALECFYIILLVVVSFAYGSEPYVRGTYGLAGAWCWITSMNETCQKTKSGLPEQVTSYSLILAVGVIGLVLMIFIVITYRQLPKALKEVRLLLRKTFIIAACLVAFIAFHVITIFVRIYSTHHTQYNYFFMWIVHAISQSISFLLFPLGFLLCFYPVTAMLSKCCCNKGFRRENTAHSHDKKPAHSTLGPTVPRSTRVSPPSNTFFNVSYTNGFTHISTEIEASLLNPCEQDFEASIDILIDQAS